MQNNSQHAFLLPIPLAQKIAAYLQTRPYEEVHIMIDSMKTLSHFIPPEVPKAAEKPVDIRKEEPAPECADQAMN